ncbi:chromosome partitioning protein [uncultured Gammaproteobacteria bacterium]
MHIVSVINYKGGVGKTTLTANLAAELAWQGKKVLVLDLDPQASLTFSFIAPDQWQKSFEKDKTIKAWFDAQDTLNPVSLQSLINRPEKVCTALNGRGCLDVIYSHLGLINVDLELATKLAGANLEQAKRNFISVHSRLAQGLNNLPARSYDVVLIDCPPNFNIVTKTALVASNYILVPARPDYLSTMGIDYLIRSINRLIKDYNDYAELNQGAPVKRIDPRILYIVFMMIQEYGEVPIAAHRQYIAETKRNVRLTGIKVMDNYIKRNDTIFGQAPAFGVPVVLNAYSSGTHSGVVTGIEKVAEEFCISLGI